MTLKFNLKISILILAAAIFSGYFLNQAQAAKKIYNPQAQIWISEADQIYQKVKAAGQGKQEAEECADADLWTTFQKSLLSYSGVVSDWSDLTRNDCLREDIWSLEDQMEKISKSALQEIEKCNPFVKDLMPVYQNLDFHVRGLRRYGEESELEQKESQFCAENAECDKALTVGSGNVATVYFSTIYTDDGCELSQKNSKKWKEEWEKLKENLNLFKELTNLWETMSLTHDWGFTEADYAAAQKNTARWWEKTWRQFYAFNGEQLQMRHLRDGEKTILDTFSREDEANKVSDSDKAEVPPEKTIQDLVQEYPMQTDVYSELGRQAEVKLHKIDLAEWKAELDYYYKGQKRTSTLDLENYLIAIDNSIQNARDFLRNYGPTLNKIQNKHCENLYPENQMPTLK